ncbi:MAG: hypothetical protein J7497_11855, partial [Chitinophagaceae bacterium]|nr:hypothetical protein [Chitinophagaceae bacterium]
GQIIFQIADDDLAVGTYTDDDQAYFVYAENQQILYESVPGPGNTDFSITITAIDSFSIEGTFSGTVKGADSSFKLISDGKFKGLISYAPVIKIAPNPDNDDYFQMGTKWVYRNDEDPNDQLTITNVGDTIINAPSGTFTYVIFENSRTGEHRYYRKDGNNFYEYTVPHLGNGGVVDPLDILIVKNDGEVGDVWETDPYTISTGGLPPVKAKLRNSVLNKDYSSVFGVITYENLMQVDTDLYVQISVQPDYQWQGGYTTIYSKGIGVIGFYDFTLNASYILTSYTP